MDEHSSQPHSSEFISSKDAANLYRVTNDYIARLCRQGKLAGVLEGRTWFVSKESLASFFGPCPALPSLSGKTEPEDIRVYYFREQNPSNARADLAAAAPRKKLFSQLPVFATLAAMLLVFALSAVSPNTVLGEKGAPLTASLANLPFFSDISSFFGNLFSHPTLTVVPNGPVTHLPVATTSEQAIPKKVASSPQPSVHASAPSVNTYQIYNSYATTVSSGVSEQELAQKLDAAVNGLRTLIYQNTSVPNSLPATGGYTNSIALSQKIDHLNTVTITNATLDGVSGLKASEIPDLSGTYLPLTGGTLTGGLTVSSTTATSTFAGGVDVTGGCLAVSGSCLSAGSLTNYWTSDGTHLYNNVDTLVGIGTTSPYAALSVVGSTGVVADHYAATSTTATSTFAAAITVGTGQGTSTFAGGLSAASLDVTSAASSTFANGINLAAGCFSINGTCITGGGSSSLSGLSDVSLTSPAFGNLLQYDGTNWVNVATSSLNIAIGDTTGTLPASRGGTGQDTSAYTGILGVNSGTYYQAATSTLSTISGTLAADKGGTGLSSYTPGSILYANSASSLATLASSTGGKVLQIDFTTGAPSWVATSSLGITGGSSAAFAWTPTADGNSTSTTIIFGNGLISQASSTFVGGITALNATTTNATTTNLHVSGQTVLGSLTGFLKATAGVVATAAVNLASDVTGILPVSNGGTGWAAIQSGAIPYGNGSSALATTTAGTNGQVLALVGGIPSWVATTTLATISGTLDLTSKVTGTLGISNGGTNNTSYSAGSLLAFDGTKFVSTSTSPLYVGSLVSTSTATSTFGGPIASASGNQIVASAGTSNYLLLNPYGGNVGIGTTSPFAAFSVQGPQQTGGTDIALYGGAGNGAATGGGILIQSGSGGNGQNGGAVTIQSGSGNNGGGAALILAGGGFSNSGAVTLTGGTSGGGSSGAVTITGGSGNFAGDQTGANVNIKGGTGISGYGGGSVVINAGPGSASNDGKILLGTTNGLVGIGTSTPYSKLTVWGNSSGNILEAVTNASSTALAVSATGFGTTTLSGLAINGSATSTSNVGINLTAGCFAVNGTCISSGGGSGAVDSVSNSDGTLTISPTTGDVIAGLNLAHGNTWTALQQFANASSTQLSASVAYFGGTATSTFTSAGFLGIGTSTPGSPLVIQTSGATSTTSVIALADSTGIIGNRIAIGTSTLHNFFVGVSAGLKNTTGSKNNFFGNVAGTNNTTGSNNNFLGDTAGLNNTTGSNNNFLGLAAGHDNTTGSSNNFIGNGAGDRNTAGSENNFLGDLAGFSNTIGVSSVAIGNQALFSNTSGSNNIALGLNAGFTNTTGSSNTYVGALSDASANNFASSTALGAGAIVGASNTLVLGGTGINAVNAGIGTTTPFAKFAIQANANDAVTPNTLFAIASSTASATTTLFSISNTGALTQLGGATSTFSNGFNLTAGCFSVNGTCVSGGGGSGTPGGSDTQIQFNSGGSFAGASNLVYITGTGLVGIGTTTPKWALEVASSTGPQLALSDGSASSNIWTFRSENGNLFIATSSPSTFATTTTNPALFVDVSNIGAVSYAAQNATATTTLNTALNVMNALTVNSQGSTTISNLYLGGLSLDTDAGVVSALNLPLSAAPSDTVESYSFNIAASTTPNLTVYGESDGSGGVKNQRVGIGTTTPGSILAIGTNNGINFSTGTSTFSTLGGLDIVAGCFAVNGTCVGGGSGSSASSTLLADANTWTGGNLFLASTTIGAGAQATGLTISGGATTTGNLIVQGTGTSTFAAGLQTTALNVTSTSASSTFANGINLTAGCFAVNGTCISSGGGSGAVDSVSNSDGTLTISPTSGDVIAGLNLAHGNTWTALQQFANASSTQLSASVAYFGGTATSTFTSAGHLGIGTSTPFANLSINQAAGENALVIGSSTATSFIVDQNGNVGIGTASPSYALHIKGYGAGSTLAPVALIQSGDTGSTASVVTGLSDQSIFSELTTDGSSVNGSQFGIAKANSNLLIASGGNVFGIGTVTSAPLVLGTNDVERLRIDASGNIGIGTTTPSAKLSVHANNGETNANLFTIASSTASATTTLFNVSNTGFATLNAGLAIGTTTNANTLTVQGVGNSSLMVTNDSSLKLVAQAVGSSFGLIGTASNHNLLFETNGTARVAITTDGNVGIGTTSPYAALSVVGSTGVVADHYDATSTSATSTFAGGFTAGLCVAEDTKLRRRRRARPGEEDDADEDGYIYEEVEIKDIAQGEEVLSLDEVTGAFVWSAVKNLAYMGEKEIFELVTATGKRIRTTGSHPYFVAPKRAEKSGQGVHPYLRGGSWKYVTHIRPGQMIATKGTDGAPVFERVLEVNSHASEGVFDVEMMGTHNFIGNGIVAHNTAFTVSKNAPVNALFLAPSGNIGLGTTTPSGQLVIQGSTATSTKPAIVFADSTGTIGNQISVGTSTLHNFFVGVGAGAANIFGNENNFFGYHTGFSNTTGSYNNFFGRDAGFSNTTGSHNNFLGYHAGLSNTTGNSNNFLGYLAGNSNTTGYRNNFLGYRTGYSNTTGHSNNFLGGYAGTSNTIGFDNNFIGRNAGYANTEGSGNNFIGVQAGLDNTTGYNNNFFGDDAGFSNTTGSNNNFLGYLAGRSNSTGTSSVAIGSRALFSNTSGSNSVALGLKSGYANTTGFSNTYLGALADASAGTFSTSTALGAGATIGASNVLILGGTGVNAVKVGIGTSTPFGQLTIQTSGATSTIPALAFADSTGTIGNQISVGTSTLHNFFVGVEAGSVITTGNSNNFLGYRTGYSNTTGSSNNFLGSSAGLSNTSGNYNNFFGPNAGDVNTSGTDNNFLGYDAGHNNTTGSNNNFFGHSAGRSNTTGSNSIAIGASAGYGYSTGAFNADLFIGSETNFLGTGTFSSTTELGHQAGLHNGGSQNVFLGGLSGQNNTSGSNNIAIGYNSLVASPTASNQLSIGNFLFGTLPAASNTATNFSLPTTGAIGIATSSPFATFAIHANNGSTKNTLFAIASSTASATTTLFSISNTGALTQLGGATSTFSGGINLTAGCFSVNGTCVSGGGGSGTPGGSDTQIQFNSGGSFAGASNLVYINDTGLVGIGTTTPKWALEVASSTGPQLALSDGSASSNIWTFRSENGNLFIATSSPSTFATTTNPALFVDVSNIGAVSYAAQNATATTTLNTALNVMNALTVNSQGSTTISNLYTGALRFDTDAGVLTAMDLPISAATAGTPEAYWFNEAASSTPNLVIYGESDGSGGVKNQRVGVGTSTPWTTLGVNGTISFQNLTGATGAGSLCLDSNNQVVYNSGSDACLASLRSVKHDINLLSLDSLSLVGELKPVSFIYNWDTSSTTRYGFIAEDTKAVDSHLTTYDANGNLSGIDDRAVLSLTVGAIQQIQQGLLGGEASTTATSSDTGSLAAAFWQGVTAHIAQWLADANNGIHDMYAYVFHAHEVDTEKLCVGDVCVTQEQFLAMVEAAGQTSVGAPSASASSTEQETTSSTDTAGAPVISINGKNPAQISVGTHYNDLGASITGPAQDLNLGISAQVDGGATTTLGQIQVDTSVAGTHTIRYFAIDQNGLMGTATREVDVMGQSATTSATTTTTIPSTTSTSTPPDITDIPPPQNSATSTASTTTTPIVPTVISTTTATTTP